jgi:uncharacterized protein (UPF0276 family)
MEGFPHLGFGIGLRPPHYQAVIDERPAVDWLEVITENFLGAGGNPRRVLCLARERYPIVLHGVSLSLGSVDPLDAGYLERLRALAAEIEPAFVSDHLCWSGFGGHTAHDLWPLPFTEEALAHVVERVRRVQDHLGRRILVENVSSYVRFASSALSEWEFLAALAERADCGLLLDVNNVFVSAHNHGFSPRAFLEGLPVGRVGQIHLAGHSDHGTHLLDTHDHPVAPGVWDLYAAAVARFGPVSTLVERDDHIPPLDELLAEARRAAAIAADVSPRAPLSLREAQACFHALVTAPESVARTLAATETPPEALAALAVGDERLSAVARLEIYAGMYFFRILDVLRDAFPRLAVALGDDAFHDLVTDYLVAHPPGHPSIGRAGDRLPAFLSSHALGRERPWLPPLARLEWALVDLYDGPDAETLAPEELARVAPERLAALPLVAIPCHELLRHDFAVAALWRRLETGEAPAVAAPEPEELLVWRQGTSVFHRRLDPGEGALLALCREGTTLGGLCERAAAGLDADVDAAARAVFTFVRRWATDGLLRAP